MKKDIKVIPVGLKGNEINERMKQLMGITPINENKSTSNVELTKIGPDGNAYAIVRENHSYFIKSTDKKENLVKEDFKYIGGYMNRVAYPSYEKAIKHLNLKFNSLAESFDAGHNINVFENDNLLSENGLAGGFANHPKGGGFSGEGNLEGNIPLHIEEADETKNNPWAICTASVGREDKTKYEACVKDVKKQKGIDENAVEPNVMEEVELSEAEQAIQKMNEEPEIVLQSDNEDADLSGKPWEEESEEEEESLKENHKLKIAKALESMDAIIDSLTEGKVKKKVYTIK